MLLPHGCALLIVRYMILQQSEQNASVSQSKLVVMAINVSAMMQHLTENQSESNVWCHFALSKSEHSFLTLRKIVG